MTEKFFQLKSFITYWLDAVNAHSLHSPFLFNFYTQVVSSKAINVRFDSIEEIRKALLKDKQILQVADFGSGSRVLGDSSRSVKNIARTGLSPKKYCRIYAQLASYYQCKTIVELGTSFGINTLYLASHPQSNVITFEGSSEIARIALQSFQKLHAENIGIVEGDLNHTLAAEVQRLDTIDLAFMDANHRYEPTMKYFECLVQKTSAKSIVIVDDIHYSIEMESAWNELKKHHRVHASADLYRCGILFFDPSLNNQHVVLQC